MSLLTVHNQETTDFVKGFLAVFGVRDFCSSRAFRLRPENFENLLSLVPLSKMEFMTPTFPNLNSYDLCTLNPVYGQQREEVFEHGAITRVQFFMSGLKVSRADVSRDGDDIFL
jgi:hypothetical protein